MASSSGSGVGACPPLDDRERFFRICTLLLDHGTSLLRQEFDKLIPPCALPMVLARHKKAFWHMPRRILTQAMMVKLYPTENTYGKSTDFDMNLLVVLFRNLCHLQYNWNSMPAENDLSLEADILRLKLYKNRIFAHAEACSISKYDFEEVSETICEIFQRRGGRCLRQKAETVLNEGLTKSENVYLNESKDWHSHDIDVNIVCHTLDSNSNHLSETAKDTIESTKKLDANTDQVGAKSDDAGEKMEQSGGDVVELLRKVEEVNENTSKFHHKAYEVNAKIDHVDEEMDVFHEEVDEKVNQLHPSFNRVLRHKEGGMCVQIL